MSSLATIDQSLGRALVQCARKDASGIAAASRGKLKRIFCLRGGALVYGASNLIEEQFAEQLLKEGLVSPEALVAARIECAADGARKLSRALVDGLAIGEAELTSALERHVRDLLFSTLDWSSGDTTLTRGTPDLTGEITIRLACPALLLEYARARPRSLDEIRMRMGSPSSRPVLSEEGERLLDGFELDAAGTFALEHSDGTRAIATLLDLSPQPLEATLRALYGLLLAGVLVPETRAKSQTSTAGAVTREEVLARFERSEGADYYAVLELGPMASTNEIREGYYFLARRYHPDRFRSGALQDLLGKIERYFAQVTEAYNNLSDAVLRAEYDASLLANSASKAAPEQDQSYLARQNFAHAKLLIERGRFTDAVTSLENAIQLDANGAEYHLELGKLLAANPRLRVRAEQCLLRAMRIDPALVDAYVGLGLLYEKLGRREEAVAQLREALRWEPGHLEAQAELDRLELGSGDSAKRRGLFRS